MLEGMERERERERRYSFLSFYLMSGAGHSNNSQLLYDDNGRENNDASGVVNLDPPSAPPESPFFPWRE